MKKFLNIVFSLSFSILIILMAVNFVVGYKPLYYNDIEKLDIQNNSGLSKEEIKLNYDYLIDYNKNKEKGKFQMPTITSSKEGKIHFEEVKKIYQDTMKISIICLIIVVIGIFVNAKSKNIKFLNLTSILLIAIPIVLAIPILLDFDKSFVVFHELLFDNDYWLFDPMLDPVINILPQEFFFHAGILILIIIFVLSVVLQGIYRYIKTKREQ